MESQDITIAAFYRFVALPDYEELKHPLLDFCKKHKMLGTIILAEEGINSTISGTREDMDAFFRHLDEDPRLKDIPRKEHTASFQPFEHMKVRLKKEIVRMAEPDIMHLTRDDAGTYVKSEDWDKLISDPEVTVIDTRNKYEIMLGKFKGAVDPKTEEFRTFPKWVEENLDPEKNKKVAMYCTGGIRCEKSTALLKQMGFADVYHLEGGILQYLEDTKNKSKSWEGECFVFDDRIAVDENLKPSKAPLCKKCGQPVTMDDIRWGENHRGITCEDCS